jgi:hypothetical protein
MKKYPLLIALLIILSGCAFGVYGGGHGFHGAVIEAPSPYYSHPGRSYHDDDYRHGDRHYSQDSGRYYRGPGNSGYYR